MGIVEFGHFYLYKMCWYSSKPRSPHLQSQVGQPGPVDAGAGPGQRTHILGVKVRQRLLIELYLTFFHTDELI